MKLYVHPMSQNSRKVLMTAHMLGVSPDVQIVDVFRGEQHAAGYLALNPNGMVPALVDGEWVLWESNAICQYLCELRPGTPLWSSDARVRADISRWMFWETAHWFPALFVFFRENMIKPMTGAGAPDEAALADGRVRLVCFAGVLESRLGEASFLVGDGVTLADIAVASHLMHADRAGVPLEEFPAVKAWFSRLTALEAWRATNPG